MNSVFCKYWYPQHFYKSLSWSNSLQCQYQFIILPCQFLHVLLLSAVEISKPLNTSLQIQKEIDQHMGSQSNNWTLRSQWVCMIFFLCIRSNLYMFIVRIVTTTLEINSWITINLSQNCPFLNVYWIFFFQIWNDLYII